MLAFLHATIKSIRCGFHVAETAIYIYICELMIFNFMHTCIAAVKIGFTFNILHRIN